MLKIVVTDVNVPCIGNMVQGEPTHQLRNSCSNLAAGEWKRKTETLPRRVEAGREGTRTIAPAYQRHGRLRSGGLRGNIQSSDGGLLAGVCQQPKHATVDAG